MGDLNQNLPHILLDLEKQHLISGLSSSIHGKTVRKIILAHRTVGGLQVVTPVRAQALYLAGTQNVRESKTETFLGKKKRADFSNLEQGSFQVDK